MSSISLNKMSYNKVNGPEQVLTEPNPADSLNSSE